MCGQGFARRIRTVMIACVGDFADGFILAGTLRRLVSLRDTGVGGDGVTREALGDDRTFYAIE